MIDLKPYGAFIENTARPLILEVKTLLDEHQINTDKCIKLIIITGLFHTVSSIIRAITEVACVGIVAWVVWKILA